MIVTTKTDENILQKEPAVKKDTKTILKAKTTTLVDKIDHVVAEKSHVVAEKSPPVVVEKTKPVIEVHSNTDPVVVRHVDTLGRGYGTGRAKNDAIARVWVSFAKTAKAVKKSTTSEEVASTTADVKVNDFDMLTYFKRDSLLAIILKPVKSLVDLPAGITFNITCTVAGGGLAGQARALSLGIARGLVVLNPEFKTALRTAGLLTRGPQGKEREKYGMRGARADLPYKRR